MGTWTWLNLAVLAAAGWYGYLEVFVPTWNPYEPAFRAIGTAVLGRCTVELHAASHRGDVWYQVRFEPVACWNEAKRAWLVVGGAERLQLSGSRNRFRASTLAADARGLSAGAIVLEIEYWNATRETAEFAAFSKDRSASMAGSEDDHGAPNVNVAPNPASHRGVSPLRAASDHTLGTRRAERIAWDAMIRMCLHELTSCTRHGRALVILEHAVSPQVEHRLAQLLVRAR